MGRRRRTWAEVDAELEALRLLRELAGQGRRELAPADRAWRRRRAARGLLVIAAYVAGDVEPHAMGGVGPALTGQERKALRLAARRLRDLAEILLPGAAEDFDPDHAVAPGKRSE